MYKGLGTVSRTDPLVVTYSYILPVSRLASGGRGGGGGKRDEGVMCQESTADAIN